MSVENADGTSEKLLSSISQNTTNAAIATEATQNNGGGGGNLTFAEALQLTKFGKFNYFLIFISGMVLANVLLETAGIGFVLPVADCDLKLTNADKGVLNAIGFIGIILSSHLWGYLADTKGRRTVIRPTLIAGFVATVFSSFSNSYWVMVVLRFINGFFVSGGSAIIYAYLGEFHTDKTRSRAMMGSSFIFAIGAMIMPLIAFSIINQEWVLPMNAIGIVFKPWRLFLIVCGIPGFLCGLALYILPESPKFLLSVEKDEEAIKVLRKMSNWNGNKEELQISRILPDDDDLESSQIKMRNQSATSSNFFVVFLRTMWNQTVPLFNKKYLRITLIVCTIQFWLYVVTYGMYMWFPHIVNIVAEFMRENPGNRTQICQIIYDKQETNHEPDGSRKCIDKLEESTYFYSLSLEIMYALSFAFIGLIINKVGKIKILFIVTILCSSCGLAAVLIPNPRIGGYFYVLFFLVGVSINILGAATVELYPTNLRAMAICISLMIGRLGSVMGATVTGILLENQCELTFYVSSIACICCAFLAFFFPRRSGADESPKEKTELTEL